MNRQLCWVSSWLYHSHSVHSIVMYNRVGLHRSDSIKVCYWNGTWCVGNVTEFLTSCDHVFWRRPFVVNFWMIYPGSGFRGQLCNRWYKVCLGFSVTSGRQRPIPAVLVGPTTRLTNVLCIQSIEWNTENEQQNNDCKKIEKLQNRKKEKNRIIVEMNRWNPDLIQMSSKSSEPITEM